MKEADKDPKLLLSRMDHLFGRQCGKKYRNSQNHFSGMQQKSLTKEKQTASSLQVMP